MVDNLDYLDLAVSCVSGIDDATKVTRNIVFKKSNNDVVRENQKKQIKDLEFLLGELKIDMQILYERNCIDANAAPSVVSPLTLVETIESSAQTDTNSNGNASCDNGRFNVNIPKPDNSLNDNEKIQQNDQYQTRTVRLKQENDKWQRKTDNLIQTIKCLRNEIEQKNQLLNEAKVFIDEKIKSHEMADDIDENFANDLNHTECQQCTFTSHLLVQTQLEKDKLNLQKSQVKKIARSYEIEIQALDRILQKNIDKNIHFEKMLDLIRNEQCALNSTNERLTQEADELRKRVVLFENKNLENDSEMMLINSQNVIETIQTQNELDSKLTIRRGVASLETPIESSTEYDNEGEEVIKHLCHLATEPISKVKQIKQQIESRNDSSSNKDIVMDTKKQTMQHVKCVSTEDEFSANSDTRAVSLTKCGDIDTKSKTKPSLTVQSKQIHRKSHSVIRPASNVVNDTPIKHNITASKRKKPKLNRSKSVSSSKPKSVDDKFQTTVTLSLRHEKKKCHLDKQTNGKKLLCAKGDAVSTGTQYISKTTIPKNLVITTSKTKTKPLVKQQFQPPKHTTNPMNDVTSTKLRSIQPAEKQKNQYNKITTKSTRTTNTLNVQPRKNGQPNISIRVVHMDEKPYWQSLKCIEATSETTTEMSAEQFTHHMTTEHNSFSCDKSNAWNYKSQHQRVHCEKAVTFLERNDERIVNQTNCCQPTFFFNK